MTENPDFKALSKTAEKWLKISEVKSWQLFDYLLGMKQQGYSIVGAEQSGKSVSLVDAVIPRKCVLLLGFVYTKKQLFLQYDFKLFISETRKKEFPPISFHSWTSSLKSLNKASSEV